MSRLSSAASLFRHRASLLARAASLLAAGALCASLLPRAQAQNIPTAIKTYSLEAFAGVTGGNPKFGPTTREIGYMAGGDITRQFKPVDVALEIRYTSITGFSADEKTYGGGLKVSKTYGRFKPYVDFLVADGGIKFDHPEIYGPLNSTYTHDSSFVYDFGGGLDYTLIRNFSFKLDVQGQRWNVGTERIPFYPYTGNVGIVYTIPFRALRGR